MWKTVAFGGILCILWRADRHALPQAVREKRTKELLMKPEVSRFTQPWPALSHIEFPSLAKSRHRVFHSAQRRLGGDGLGHGFGITNLEVATAMVCPDSF